MTTLTPTHLQMLERLSNRLGVVQENASRIDGVTATKEYKIGMIRRYATDIKSFIQKNVVIVRVSNETIMNLALIFILVVVAPNVVKQFKDLNSIRIHRQMLIRNLANAKRNLATAHEDIQGLQMIVDNQDIIRDVFSLAFEFKGNLKQALVRSYKQDRLIQNILRTIDSFQDSLSNKESVGVFVSSLVFTVLTTLLLASRTIHRKMQPYY